MFEFHEVAAHYPGLRPFEPYESEIFFGREGHTDRLLEILQRERFLAVIGPSGCGKSSLVRAGLLPGLASGALGTGSDWRLALLRPGGQPLLALAQALLSPYALGRELVGESRLPKDAEDVTADVALVAAELRRGPAGLAALVQTAAAHRPQGAAPFNLLVLVDQFEEIFTYAQTVSAKVDESEAFIDMLLAARALEGTHPGPLPEGEGDNNHQNPCPYRIYVVLTMRTDFLGHCVRFLELPEAINRAQYLTPRLSLPELELAITGPAQVFGGEVESGLVAGLIDRISHDSDQLPILQHALARMWRVAETAKHDSPVIDASCAEEVGGVAGALNRHADDVLAVLTPEQQALAEALFRAITERRESGGQDVRRPQSLAAIADWAGVPVKELKLVIEVFAVPEVSFLHYGRELTDKSIIDLTHEALIRQWARLRSWVESEHQRGQGYRRWTQRAVEHRDGGGLLTGGDLARALEWWNPEKLPLPAGQIGAEPIWSRAARQKGSGQDSPETLGWGEGLPAWQPTPHWAQRYSDAKGDALIEEFERTRQFLIDSCDVEQRKQERQREQKRLEEQAEAERQRAEKERRLADEARASESRARQLAHEARVSESRARRMTKITAVVALLSIGLSVAAFAFKHQAQFAERQRTVSLFESQLTHGSLLAQVEDYAEARRVLAESMSLDPEIPASRRHARNLLEGFAEMIGGRAEQVYAGAGAALSGGLAVSPDDKLLAAAGERGTLVLFDADSGKLLRRLEGHDPKAGLFEDMKLRLEGHDPKADLIGNVNSVVVDSRGRWLFSGGTDGRIIRWSLSEGGKLGEWQAPNRVHALAPSPDGAILASGGVDAEITLWSVADGKKIRTLVGHTNSIATPNGLTFSPDGSRLASASYDKTARLWDWRTGKSLLVLAGYNQWVEAVAFSPDGKLLATASADNQVKLWDIDSFSATFFPIRVLSGHQNTVSDVAFSTDGRQLLSASLDNTLRLWDVASGSTRRIYQGHVAGLWSVAVRGDNLYTAAIDATVRRWTLVTPQQWVWEMPEEPDSVAISPDAKLLAIGFKNGTLRLFDSATGQALVTLENAHGSNIYSLVFDQGGTLLATAGFGDKTAKIWRLDRTGTDLHLVPLNTLKGHTGAVYRVAFSPDGRRLATASYDGQIGLFDAASGQGRLFPAHEGRVESIAFSPDGKRLLSGGSDRRLRLWNLDELTRPPQEIAQALDELLWASLSPDGREIAAVGREIVVSLYDLAKPGTSRRLVGHESTVYRAIYSPDGRQLATVSADMTVRLWDLDSQRLLFRLRLPTEFQQPTPLWDFDFRCTAEGDCWIAVPLTVGRLALYRLSYDHPPVAAQTPANQDSFVDRVSR